MMNTMRTPISIYQNKLRYTLAQQIIAKVGKIQELFFKNVIYVNQETRKAHGVAEPNIQYNFINAMFNFNTRQIIKIPGISEEIIEKCKVSIESNEGFCRFSLKEYRDIWLNWHEYLINESTADLFYLYKISHPSSREIQEIFEYYFQLKTIYDDITNTTFTTLLERTYKELEQNLEFVKIFLLGHSIYYSSIFRFHLKNFCFADDAVIAIGYILYQ